MGDLRHPNSRPLFARTNYHKHSFFVSDRIVERAPRGHCLFRHSFGLQKALKILFVYVIIVCVGV